MCQDFFYLCLNEITHSLNWIINIHILVCMLQSHSIILGNTTLCLILQYAAAAINTCNHLWINRIYDNLITVYTDTYFIVNGATYVDVTLGFYFHTTISSMNSWICVWPVRGSDQMFISLFVVYLFWIDAWAQSVNLIKCLSAYS